MPHHRFATRILLVLAATAALAQQPPDPFLWREGRWAVAAPTPGACATYPVLRVLGPGSIFDPANAAALSSLEAALPGALAKVCPELRELILISVRTRRLVKLTASGVTTGPVPEEGLSSPRAQQPQPQQQQPPPSPRSPSSAASPSALKSLDSARDIEDKCDALVGWLETSKQGPDTRPAYHTTAMRTGAVAPPLMRVFRDEPMSAVFGMPYDKTENRWRLDLYEHVISRCLGFRNSRTSILASRAPSRTLLQYAQQLSQYRQVLDQAFLGQPGAYEPAAITRYVQQLREQLAWSNQALDSAAAAPPARESFDAIATQRTRIRTQLTLLTAAEQSQVDARLARRQAELAPAIAQAWLKDATARSAKNVASAKALQTGYSSLGPVVAAMEPAAANAFTGQYQSALNSLVADSVAAETAKLPSMPATVPGAQQLTAWKAGFDASFRDLQSVPSVAAANEQYKQARTRIASTALPAWLKEVARTPDEVAGLAARRKDLEAFFPTPDDRSSPIYTQFESPLRTKEDQFRIRYAAAEAARQQNQPQQQPPPPPQQQQQPAVAGGGPFNAKGLTNEAVLIRFYEGDFAAIGFDREDSQFVTMFEHYLRSYARQCDRHLPPNKVEIMNLECKTERVTRNGYGVETSRYCVDWVQVPSGLFADPVLLNAQDTASRLYRADAARQLGKMFNATLGNRSNPAEGVFKIVGDVMATVTDMKALVQMNACTSPALKRFEDNLRLFALNRPASRPGAPAGVSPALVAVPGLAYRDHDYARLIEDLVVEHSKGWAMNRYIRGSTSNVAVVSRDQGGRPAKLKANYFYNGFQGRMSGSVTLDFSDGLPECMYFADYPASCRTPNRKVVAAYAEGVYQQK